MITRQLQQAADDLGEVELALISIYNGIMGEFCVPSPKPPKPQEPQLLIRMPGVERCRMVTMKGTRCTQPAIRLDGLCGNHFLRLHGHELERFENTRWDVGYRCACGREIGPHHQTKVVHELVMKARQEFCPLKVGHTMNYHRSNVIPHLLKPVHSVELPS